MFRNYMVTVLRAIQRNKLFTVINLAGLSVAMACFILVGLYVRYELSYDRFHDRVEDIHIVQMKYSEEMGGFTSSFVPAVLSEALESQLPAIEHAVVTNTGAGSMIVEAANGQFLQEKYYAVNNSFFDVFTFPLLYGDKASALTEPTSVVISLETAIKYFDTENAVGEVLKVDGKGAFRVSGILKPFPKNSQFQPHFLLPFEAVNSLQSRTSWNMNAYFVYIKTLPGTDLEKLKNDIWDVYEVKKAEGVTVVSAHLEAFTDGYWEQSFGAQLNNRDRGLGANKDVIYVCSGLTILLLFIALANYVNMATAKAVERAKEVGIRKVNGASQKQLRAQFLGETILFALLSLVVALILVELLLPSVSEVLGIPLKVDYSDPSWLLSLLGYAMGCGLLAGIYPAIFLSRFNPVRAIKGDLNTRSSRFSPKGILLFLQFTISGTMVVVLLMANAQIRHYLDFDLGFEKEQVISIHAPVPLRKDGPVVMNQVRNLGGVAAATKGPMPFGGDGSASVAYEDKKLRSVAKAGVDADFLPLFEIDVVSGRNFDNNRLEDFENTIMINQALAGALELENPVGQIVKMADRPVKVIGVCKNFYINGALSDEEPLFLYPTRNSFSRVLIKLRPGNPTETLAALEEIWQPYLGRNIFKYDFLDQAYANRVSRLQRITLIVNGITVSIVTISLFGLFSLVAFHISRKLKDIGIRKVLGASAAHIMLILSKPYMTILLLSTSVALPLAYYLMREVLSKYPHQISLGPAYGTMAFVAILSLSALVLLSRALSAIRTNPVDILRNE
ncbi:MAG: FtsX-like permease family protein [Roseivirga sp.]|nr:FtsX-like permease family protein [Roseivirga sp.]